MNTDYAGRLLKALGDYINLPNISFNDEHKCTLAFDDTLIVSLIADDEFGLNAVAFVGFLPEESNEEEMFNSLRYWLEQNFLPANHGGARFCIEPNSNKIVLVQRWNAQTCEGKVFISQFEALVNSLEVAHKQYEKGFSKAVGNSLDVAVDNNSTVKKDEPSPWINYS